MHPLGPPPKECWNHTMPRAPAMMLCHAAALICGAVIAFPALPPVIGEPTSIRFHTGARLPSSPSSRRIFSMTAP
jgi:hypothetical protein